MDGNTVLSQAGPAHLKQLSDAAPGRGSSLFFHTLYEKQTKKDEVKSVAHLMVQLKEGKKKGKGQPT